MEIERKYLIEAAEMPENCLSYPFLQIEQAYLSVDPVVRIRRQDDSFYLTYKSRGKMAREEYNLPLNAQSYAHLLAKADGLVLTKKRYLIPAKDAGIPASPLTIELDVFEGAYQGLVLAEVEFSSKEEARPVCASHLVWTRSYLYRRVSEQRSGHEGNLAPRRLSGKRGQSGSDRRLQAAVQRPLVHI